MYHFSGDSFATVKWTPAIQDWLPVLPLAPLPYGHGTMIKTTAGHGKAHYGCGPSDGRAI